MSNIWPTGLIVLGCFVSRNDPVNCLLTVQALVDMRIASVPPSCATRASVGILVNQHDMTLSRKVEKAAFIFPYPHQTCIVV
jgi:hypothetical protein